MSSSPVRKKRKAEGNNDAQSASAAASWRAKSIEKFGLKPVPDEWKDSVAIGSEDAWKRYYEYRSNKEDEDAKKMTDTRFEEDGYLDFLKEWKSAMTKRIEAAMVKGCKWHWTPHVEYLGWNENSGLDSATYHGSVWSPFAIPHAIDLCHSYHHNMRLNGLEFSTDWEYRLVDFEDEETIKSKDHTELCKCYEDADIEHDGIETENLTKATYQKMRRFLFGTSSKESEKVTCSDIDFWLLIFGSMGSTDEHLSYDLRSGNLGYSWTPGTEMRQKLYDMKANEGDANPNLPFNEYYPGGCSWLKHRVLEITGRLGPITKHYVQPKPKYQPRRPVDDFYAALSYGGDY